MGTTVPSGTGFASSTETYTYGYHHKTTSMRLAISTGLNGCAPTFPPTSTFAPEQVWTYRYGPNGVREQRRLMMSPLHDSADCSGILPWTYYVNDPSGLVLAVYHGRQMKRSQLGAGCPDPPTPPTQPTRRVYMYPVEYRAYGPDGINVVYERENYGVNAGQWVKRYLTTDYQGSVLQAHDASGNHEQHYELFGAEKGQVARRTGWLDREIDWETSPLSDLYRTVDLVNRKYDPQRATFLTSDPLWMMSADASSYHYGYHDPMNMIDPWGLDGITTWCEDDPPIVVPMATSSSDPEPFNNTGWHDLVSYYLRLMDALDDEGRRILTSLVSAPLIRPGSIRDDTPPQKLSPIQVATMMRGNQEARLEIVKEHQKGNTKPSDNNHESGGYLFGSLPTSFTTVQGNFKPMTTVNGKWSGAFMTGLTALWHTHSQTGGEPPSIPDLYWITSAAHHKGQDALGIAVMTHTYMTIYAVKISDLARATLFGEMMEHFDQTKLGTNLTDQQRIDLARGFSVFIRQYGGVTEWTTSPYGTFTWSRR